MQTALFREAILINFNVFFQQRQRPGPLEKPIPHDIFINYSSMQVTSIATYAANIDKLPSDWHINFLDEND